jgi:hypothetical protein
MMLKENSTIISFNGINQLIFVMETRCVFLEVGTERLNITHLDVLQVQRVYTRNFGVKIKNNR